MDGRPYGRVTPQVADSLIDNARRPWCEDFRSGRCGCDCSGPADAVARLAIESHIEARRVDAQVVRNGSRGLFWLEPMVEVETPKGRVAYGPVTADAVAGLF